MTVISTLGQALDQMERIKVMQTQLADFQRQLATGKKGQLFHDLGTSVIPAQRARADFKMFDNFINNIDIAGRRINLMSTALDEIKEQAINVSNSLEVQTQQGEFELDTINNLADSVFNFLESLVNQQDGNRYLLGGAVTTEEPLINTGTLDTYLTTQLSDWINTTIDSDQLIANYRDRANLPDTLVGYNSALSGGTPKNIFVRVDEHAELDYTVLGNGDAIRDIIVAVGMVKTLTSQLDEVTLDPDDPVTTVTAPGATKQEQNDQFFQVFNDLIRMMNTAIDSIDQERFKLSQVQAQMSQIKERHITEKNVLLSTISDIEDADINEVAVQLNSLQVQLEASFRVTAAVRDLSLVNFI